MQMNFRGFLTTVKNYYTCWKRLLHLLKFFYYTCGDYYTCEDIITLVIDYYKLSDYYTFGSIKLTCKPKHNFELVIAIYLLTTSLM